MSVLARLARLNPRTVFLVTLAVVLAALFAPDPIGGALLLALAAGLGVLLAQTWTLHAPTTRLLRVLVLGLLVVVAIGKLS
jgi:energy-coupling factor transporter transmembrane protein EcfT